MADTWFDRRTYRRPWDLEELLVSKAATSQRVSLVLPARDEAETVGGIVARIREAFVDSSSLVDELVVIDGDSTDDTARIAREAGAEVHTLADIRPDLGTRTGKGEAIWKSQFVTSGSLLVFIDADLTDWDTHFVTSLLGPLLTDPTVALVKGFYERPLRSAGVEDPHGGGRVTELVARPLLALARPELGQVVQPLAGEWAVRREVYETLRVPTGYGVDLAALLDVSQRLGLDAIAQVDLGRRAHSHQPVSALAAMATQIMSAVIMRTDRGGPDLESAVLRQFAPAVGGFAETTRDVDLTERQPAIEVTR